MTKHAYYMTQRPFSIGAQPKEGLVEVEDFDCKKRVEEIGRDAWSRIVYDRELTEQEIDQYELVPAEAKRPEGHGEETFIYRDGAIGYAHSDFSVIDMPEWMTMDEAALVIDRGNLCFGFRTSGSTVTICTD